MESRKRSRADDSEPVSVKKVLLSDSRGSPIPVNGAGHDTDEPKDGDNLEVTSPALIVLTLALNGLYRCSGRMLSIEGCGITHERMREIRHG